MTDRQGEPDASADRGQLGRIESIQYLRAVAAMMVVWHHTREQFPGLKAHFPSESGTSGVDLFFVISGFIMVATTYGKPVTVRQFMARRIVRVVPLYWLLTAVLVAIALASPSLMKTVQPSLAHVVQSLLFIPHPSPTHLGTAWPVLVPGWTLNFEMFFYLVFSLTLFFSSRLRLAALCVFLSSLVVAGYVLSPVTDPLVATYTSPLLLEFLVGSVIAQLTLRGHRVSSTSLAVGLMVLGVLLLLWKDAPVPPYPRVVGAALLVTGALSPGLRHLQMRVLLALGNASYSIYLSHLFSLGMLRWAWGRWFDAPVGATAVAAFMVAGVAVGLGIGWVVYRWVEVPLLNSLQPRVGRPRAHLPLRTGESR